MSKDLEKLARSNYLLLKIRETLSLKGELFTKWDQVNYAFNGGYFFNEEDSLTNIYFHDLQFFREDLKPIQVGNMLISIGTQQDDVDWQDLLNQANTEFDDLLKEKSESILLQVNRFLLFLGCFEKQENPQRIKTLINQICKDFPNVIIYPLEEIFPGFESLGKQFNFMVEVVFDAPISRDIFIEILKKHLPNLQDRIFGYGYRARNPVPETECWITLYGRQF